MPRLTQILAQKYKLEGRTTFQGLSIAIENKRGSIRRGVSRNGKKWETEMKYPYGYIVGSRGLDKDPLDCYIGPYPNAKFAFVVHQLNPSTGAWDEDKVMLGFNDTMQAKEAYYLHYDEPDKFFGTIDAVPMDLFKKKVEESAKNPTKISAAKAVEVKIGDSVTVDGFHGRGVATKIEGRRVTVRFWSSEYITRDMMYVHPFRENEVNKMWRDDRYRNDGAQIKAGGPGSGPNAPCPQCGPRGGRISTYRSGSGVARALAMLKQGPVTRARFHQEFGNRSNELMTTLRRHGRQWGNWRISDDGRNITLTLTRGEGRPQRGRSAPEQRPWYPEMSTPTERTLTPEQRSPKGFLKKEGSSNLRDFGPLIRTDMSEEGLRKFQRQFEMSPKDLRELLVKGLSQDLKDSAKLTIRQDGLKRWSIDMQNRAFHFSRDIDLDRNLVYHSSFVVQPGTRNAGVGKTLFNNMLDLYDHLGIEKVKVSAGLSVGGYAWARFGFSPNRDDWQVLRYRVKERAESMSPDIKAQVNLISKLDDPKAVWLLAALKDSKGRNVGKDMLLGSSWDGSLDLRDKEAYGVTRYYASGSERRRIHASEGKRSMFDELLDSEEGQAASDRLAVAFAVAHGWSQDKAEEWFGSKDIQAVREWTELEESKPVDRKPVIGGFIEQQGTLFCVKNAGGENFGCYANREDAQARLSNIQIHAGRGIKNFGITKADKEILQAIGDDWTHGGKLSKRAVLLHKAGYLHRHPKGFHFKRTPKGRAAMLDQEVECSGVKQIKADYGGEPMAGNMAHSHIDPVVWFHPPSQKNPERVPADDPREDNDKYLDVTKRNSKDTQLFKMKLLKRQQVPGGMTQIPARTTLINPHQAVYMPSMFDAADKKKVKQRPAKPIGGKRTHVTYARRGCI